MQEKKVFWRHNPLRTIFGDWNNSEYVLGRKNYKNNLRGFTLIELLVAMMILGVLLSGLILTIDPKKQLDKAKDAQRQSDLQQIKNALDMYYNDYAIYPILTSLPTGQWKIGNTVYMAKVPKDPNDSAYTYYYSSGTRPQWAVLYAKLSKSGASCALTNLSNCLPIGYTDKWTCVLLGSVDCSSIRTQTLQ